MPVHPLVAMRRELTRRAIDLNPLTIALKRELTAPDGIGGRRVVETVTLGPQRFRLYMSSYRASINIAKEGGQMQVNQWGLLAEHDANIQIGDTFDLKASEVAFYLHEGQMAIEEIGGYAFDDRTYRVVKIDPVRLLGEVVGLQVAIEEVV